MRKKAFTLIELLVVIAIIAILAAILFPVFAQARESARKTVCLSNVKEMGLGMMMYTQDYDERMVLWEQGSGTSSGTARGTHCPMTVCSSPI
jgi:prepilin-type N-terminal cleavage/methylation domain-containing protein